MLSLAQSIPYGQPQEASFAPSPYETDDPTREAERAEVKLWQSRIKESKRKFEPDFKRMRANMEFVTGLQWPNQVDLQGDERYSCNLTLRLVAQKVATLYAKNPTLEVTRRKQLDYQVWSGDVTELMQAMEAGHIITSSGGILPPDLEMLLQDIEAGKKREQLVDKVCKTLNFLYQYFVDAQKPDYKEQCKAMVRSAVICGVGYIRPIFCDDANGGYRERFSVDTGSTREDRVARAKEILKKRQENEIADDNSEMSTLRSLLLSLGAGSSMQDSFKLPQRLEWDFPMGTSVLVDTRCRSLKEFVAARWIAIEYILPIDEINALFGVEIEVGSGEGMATEYQVSSDTLLLQPNRDQSSDDPYKRKQCSLYEIFDYNSKTRSFIVQGHKDYVVPPEPIFPAVSGFWPLQALVFNDTVVDPDTRASIYPPSDVDLVRHAQLEWNRTRDALRNQRNANAPKYLVRKGTLTPNDILALKNAQPNAVIQLEGVPMDQPIEKFIAVMQVAAIDPAVYDTTPLEQDLMLAGGAQQANIGPAQPNVTATVGTIAEQSRMTVTSSNVDDLDGVLTRSGRAGIEMLLQAYPVAQVRIAGAGATLPNLARQEFLQEIDIQIKAASSGRPNKAVEIANFQQIAPILLNAGSNPFGVVQEGVRRLDDALDVEKFLPIQQPALEGPMQAPTQPASSQASSQGQPPAPNPQNNLQPQNEGNKQ